jgi:hypothetical protein
MQQAESSRGAWRKQGAKWVRAISGDIGDEHRKRRDELLHFAALVFADLPTTLV